MNAQEPPATTEDDQQRSPTGAVLLEWCDGMPPRWWLFSVEDALIDVLREHPEVGVLDGNEVSPGGATIYLYGPDCDALWRTVESTVRKIVPPPTRVTVTPGEIGAVSREVFRRDSDSLIQD